MRRKRSDKAKAIIAKNVVLYRTKILPTLGGNRPLYLLAADLEISLRFLKKLIKYRGRCYKRETVIDRIKPILDKEYGERGIREKTWGWLKNPATNYNLRIDIYYPSSNIAVEFNGPQHYMRGKGIRRAYGPLKKQQQRDSAKYRLLAEHNITLRIITHEDTMSDRSYEYTNNSLEKEIT